VRAIVSGFARGLQADEDDEVGGPAGRHGDSLLTT
jgi:hypothetical protein